MYICMTERQKMETTRTGIMVVEFNRLLKQVVNILNLFTEMVKRCVGSLIKLRERFRYLPIKAKYRAIRKLNKCGFTEKEINLMVLGAYHCRNNC